MSESLIRSPTTAPGSFEWLDQARVVAIMAVTVIHVSAAAVTKPDLGSYEWWVGIFYNSVTRWCVPVFVMISGFLLLDPSRQEDWRTFYHKRASRILIPLVFWTIFYLAWKILRGVHLHEPADPVEMIWSVIGGVPAFHLWFLYMIVGLYLFTPFLRKMLAGLQPDESLLLCALGFFIVAVTTALSVFTASEGHSRGSFLTGFLPYLPYFIAGHVFGRVAPAISLRTALAVTAVAVAATMLFSFALWPSGFGQYPGNYNSITVIPMSYGVFLALRTGNGGKATLWKHLSPLAFGIYLVHLFYFSVLGQLGLSIELFNPVLSIPAFAALIFLCSAASVWVMSKLPGLRRCI